MLLLTNIKRYPCYNNQDLSNTQFIQFIYSKVYILHHGLTCFIHILNTFYSQQIDWSYLRRKLLLFSQFTWNTWPMHICNVQSQVHRCWKSTSWDPQFLVTYTCHVNVVLFTLTWFCVYSNKYIRMERPSGAFSFLMVI